MNGAAPEEEICDNIRKGDRVRKSEAIRHRRARFQAVIVAKESIKIFMQRG